MNKPLVAVALAVLLAIVLYFGFTNKPPHISVYDELREKLIDSLSLPGEDELIRLQNDLKKAAPDEKASLLKDLSTRWLTIEPAIAADYLRQLADLYPTYDGYMVAGNLFLDQVPSESRENIRVNIVYGSRYCFEEAEKLKPGDIDSRIGQASILVEGTNNPMEGVMLLREIEKEDPGNEKVNMQLGRFSMMSGQFDKAVERFSSVIAKDSLNLQSRFLLAQSYLGLQDTVKAVEILKEMKILVHDPAMKQQVEVQINNLDN